MLHDRLHWDQSSGKFFRFNNIRYAQAPINKLRFARPQPPTPIKKNDIQDGSQARKCPQAVPAWQATAGPFLAAYLSNTTYTPRPANAAAAPTQDPAVSEDCLFLDVVVPQCVFRKQCIKSKGAPVMVWVHGGGYSSGSKNSQGDPSGLLYRSQEGVIYVSFNYRLGAFGWLSGPDYVRQGGVPNVGFFDQAMAIKWVRDHIRSFGGDPNRITVFGESAGASSILHHVTAPRSLRPQFAQAILQSPAFQPIVDPKQQNEAFAGFLKTAKTSDLATARTAPFQSLSAANIISVGGATYGAFTFGPSIDTAPGSYVPDLPGRRLADGLFDPKLHVMVGHNANEGLLFTSPDENSTSTIKEALTIALPSLNEHKDVLDHIVDDLYPEPSSKTASTLGYYDQTGRAALLIADLVVNCNTFYMNKAYKNQTYAYLFSIPPALHAQDLFWTYYSGAGQAQPQNASVSLAFGGVTAPDIAIALQSYLTSFAMQGGPNRFQSDKVPRFEKYNKKASVKVLKSSGIVDGVDPAANPRCNYWQTAPYFTRRDLKAYG